MSAINPSYSSVIPPSWWITFLSPLFFSQPLLHFKSVGTSYSLSLSKMQKQSPLQLFTQARIRLPSPSVFLRHFVVYDDSSNDDVVLATASWWIVPFFIVFWLVFCFCFFVLSAQPFLLKSRCFMCDFLPLVCFSSCIWVLSIEDFLEMILLCIWNSPSTLHDCASPSTPHDLLESRK